jgi:RHS repeat-associated protein
VLEDGKRVRSEIGAVQGGSISPLLSNIYLHYVLDLWVQRWRRKQARGEITFVRFADDFVAGFQHRWEAERFLQELRERFARFGLQLHADKTRIVEFGSFAGEDQTSVEYAYDLAGKALQVADPTGSYGFAYDNMGRLIETSTQYSFLPGLNFQNAYTYDAASNRTSLVAPDGSITTYGYDTLNRLNGLANSWAGSFGFGYDALSRRTSLTRPNGVNTSYAYDRLSHLLSVLHQAGVNTLDGASYTYDPAGNRTSKTNYLNGITSNYSYDLIYELTQVLQGGTTTESYSYDAIGNRLSALGSSGWSYNASNELISNPMGSFTYDSDGNTLIDAAGRSYTWDFENRLTQAVNPGVGTTNFKYDPFGRRIQKSGPLGTTNYLYSGLRPIGDIDGSGNVIVRYTTGRGIDEPLSELLSMTTSYYEQDALGSITSLSNSAGSLASTYTFNSFGMLTASTGTITNRFQYTGREFDQETGIYDYRNRYYDQEQGRFLSEDPIRFRGGLNVYQYARNNAATYVDHLGLLPTACQWCHMKCDLRFRMQVM